MNISLGTWAFSFGPHADDPVPFDRVVRKLADAGYDGVEICGFAPHVTPEDYSTQTSRQTVVDLLSDLGLGISGYSPDITVDPAAEGNRTRYLEQFRRHLQLCADLGSPLMRLDTVSAPGSITLAEHEDAIRRIAGVWNNASEIAAEAGIKLAWEFEPGYSFNSPTSILRILELVDQPNFGVLFDTAHAYMCSVVGARQRGKETLEGGVVELLEKLKHRVLHVHIIDSDGTLYGRETSAHTPFGDGKIDFEALAPKLLEIDAVEWWCVDLCFCAESWELVGPSLAFVRKLLNTVSGNG